MAGLIQAFERQPAGERAIADDRDDSVVLFAKVARHGDAERCGN